MTHLRHRLALLILFTGAIFGQPVVETVAGGFRPNGTPAASTVIGMPGAVAVDGAGNVYLAAGRRFDGNPFFGGVPDNIIYRIDPLGVISVVAGDGGSTARGDGGPALNASFNSLGGIAVDTAGTVLYAADSGTGTVRRVDLRSGIITAYAGGGTGGDAGPASQAFLDLSADSGLAVDNAGNLYIGVGRVRRVDAGTGIITTVAGGAGATFGGATAIAADTAGNVYFVAIANNATRVYRIAGGTGAVTALPMNPAPANITGIAVDRFGRLYLSDGPKNKVYQASPAGEVVVYAGTGTEGFSGDGGQANAAMLGFPDWLAIDSTGALYLSDSVNFRLRRVDAGGQIRTVAGTGVLRPANGSPANQFRLTYPQGMAVSGRGIYLCETTIKLISRIDLATNQLTTVAGLPYRQSPNDFSQGNLGGAPMPFCSGMGADPQGNLFFADNNVRRVLKVTMPDLRYSTLQFPAQIFPRDLAVDNQGNVFVADGSTPFLRSDRIWKVAPGAAAVSVAGNGNSNFSGDGGPATGASFRSPWGIAVDRDGSFYIADTGNNRIRKVDTGGFVQTIAGTGQSGYSGDFGQAAAAQFNAPRGLALDGGFLYVADSGNHAIRRIELSTGAIVTIAGNGTAGFRDGPAASSLFDTPTFLAVESGTLYLTDSTNRVRRITQPRAAVTPPISSVSAAGFQTGPVAPDSIVAAFGSRLAAATVIASTSPPPDALGGVSVRVRDSAGVERPAGLFFVSSGQANYLMPAATALGAAQVTLASGQSTFTGVVQVARVAPGIFTLNTQALAAANLLRVSGDGTQSVEDVFQLDAAQAVIARAIDLGPATDRVFLLLYGTGFRNRLSDASVQAAIGGVNATVIFSGAQGSFPGLDQMNVEIPRALIGRGDVEIRITVEGAAANVVRIRLR